MFSLSSFSKYSAITPKQYVTFAAVAAMTLGYVLVTVLQSWSGWILISLSLLIAWRGIDRQARKYYFMILGSIAIMAAAPVSTSTSEDHMIALFCFGAAALAIPYVISHRIYKHPIIHFHLDFHRRWPKLEVGLAASIILLTIVFLWLFFSTTNAHTNWPLGDARDIMIVFTWIMLIGLWEEFFFIATVFGVLQRFLPMFWANLFQAVMMTSFLYQFGFRGWIVPFVFLYSLCQGFIFYFYKNLLINVTIHFFVDLGVFLILLWQARPDLFLG